MLIDDNNLLESLRNGDEDAFRQLFEMYSDPLFRLSLSILSNDEDAEDVVQDAVSRFFQRLNQFEGRSKISTWLYRAVYNASIDKLRQRKNTIEWVDEEFEFDQGTSQLPANFTDWTGTPEKLLEQAELRSLLDKAADSLPQPLKSVFLLRDIEQLSTADAGKILGLTPSAVKVRLHRARLILREQLGDHFTFSTQHREKR